MDLAEQVPFHALCHVLDAVQRQPSSNKAAKEKLMEQFIEVFQRNLKIKNQILIVIRDGDLIRSNYFP